MELSERLQAEIVNIFAQVQWGEITFKLSPESKTLDYAIRTTGKLLIDERLTKPGTIVKVRKTA